MPGTFEPILPPPDSGQPRPPAQPGGGSRGTKLEAFGGATHLPPWVLRPAQQLGAVGPSLADATTAAAVSGSGGNAPNIVPVPASGSNVSLYLILGALAVGAVIAVRWWQRHQKGK